jgi:hypothetical protein
VQLTMCSYAVQNMTLYFPSYLNWLSFNTKTTLFEPVVR